MPARSADLHGIIGFQDICQTEGTIFKIEFNDSKAAMIRYTIIFFSSPVIIVLL